MRGFSRIKRRELKNKGTEGSCYVCYDRLEDRIVTIKKARVYPDGEGIPYYMLRELAFLRQARHPHVMYPERIHLHNFQLHGAI